MKKQESETIIINLGDKTLTFNIKDFGSGAIDVEDLLQVDTNAVVADMATFPVIFNRLARFKAEVDSLLAEVKLDCSIFEASLFKKHKKAILAIGDKATEAAIDAEVKLDPEYKIKKKQVIDVQHQADIIDGLYWSAKSKDKKLDAISAKIKPEEFEGEILEGTINSVAIRVYKNQFENRKKN